MVNVDFLKTALRLAAPATWTASACPALFGILYCAVRGFPLRIEKAVALLAACILLQSAVNTLNDYFDFIKGTDSRDDFVDRNDSVLVYGDITAKQAFRLAMFYLTAGVILGLLCCNGIVSVLVGLAGGAVLLLYSAGPLPLSYLPVGELVSGTVMGGLIPLGIAGCADGTAHWEVLLWSFPFILGISLIMMTNNGCDIEKDCRASRRTLPSLLGRSRTVTLYRVQSVLWLFLLALLPVLLLGKTGLIAPLLLVIVGRKPFQTLLHCHLEPDERVKWMKTIAAGNLYGGGAYVIALILFQLTGARYG